ncbi:Gfo/Idh/MocA family protein [Cohnella zeiphila]|uniref:Gfo/Idh/MocA family oxidoreductase n=1 Tax=Cohnella zeiphila TaxID=2761120 RepID=A0A7X0VXI5_9BACL|nr:Gfo/Idh/MocA family oxidoreductase [Cohnella zeiphila]MBB6734319.1 Gfo/Idh/MocA family oxidoreductase [Cohnella zeiphila]
MKFAIVGCQHAHIGLFLKEMLELGHECAGICEAENEELAAEMSRIYQVPVFSGPDSFLDASIEVIGCADVNSRKIDVIEWCERHGKHVMVDKPAVTNEEDLQRLRRVAERGRIRIGMMLTERFRPSVIALKRMIDEGELGRIVHLHMRKPHLLNPRKRPAWHFDKERNGGLVIDLLVHDLDLLRWLTGSELRASSGIMTKSILPEHPHFYDSAAVQALTENGTTAQLYADWHTPAKSWTWGDCRLFATGTRGSAEIRLEGDPLVAREEILIAVTDAREPARIALPDPGATLSEDFLRRIAGEPGCMDESDILAASEAAIRTDRNTQTIGR